MKNNANRLLGLLLAALMLLGLTACGKNKQPSDPNHIVIGDYELQYKGASIMTDSEGKDAVVLTMDFMNNGKDTADYLWSIFEKAMQDGIELEGAIVYVSEDSYETVTDSQFTEIASGKTIEVRSAYTLRDTENPVEVTFTDLLQAQQGGCHSCAEATLQGQVSPSQILYQWKSHSGDQGRLCPLLDVRRRSRG